MLRLYDPHMSDPVDKPYTCPFCHQELVPNTATQISGGFASTLIGAQRTGHCPTGNRHGHTEINWGMLRDNWNVHGMTPEQTLGG